MRSRNLLSTLPTPGVPMGTDNDAVGQPVVFFALVALVGGLVKSSLMAF